MPFLGDIAGGIAGLFGGGGLGLGDLLSAGGSFLGGLGSKNSTSKPVYTPQQSQLQGSLYNTLSQRLADPSVNLDPLQTTATGEINSNYASLEDRMRSSLVGRGFGRSGKLGLNTQALELSRQGDLGDLASRFAGYQLDQQNRDIDEALRYAFAYPGTNTSSGSLTGGLGGLLGSLAGSLPTDLG